MLFAIAADFLKHLPLKNDLILCICTGLLEITNGIHLTANATLSFHIKYLIDIFIVSFGGISGLFQTASMLRNNFRSPCDIMHASNLYVHFWQQDWWNLSVKFMR